MIEHEQRKIIPYKIAKGNRPNIDVYNGLADNSEIPAIPWDFIKCGQCKPDSTCTGIQIRNPDISAIEMIKKLILLSMCEIDEKCLY